MYQVIPPSRLPTLPLPVHLLLLRPDEVSSTGLAPSPSASAPGDTAAASIATSRRRHSGEAALCGVRLRVVARDTQNFFLQAPEAGQRRRVHDEAVVVQGSELAQACSLFGSAGEKGCAT
jgi:hypothetical protein